MLWMVDQVAGLVFKATYLKDFVCELTYRPFGVDALPNEMLPHVRIGSVTDVVQQTGKLSRKTKEKRCITLS